MINFPNVAPKLKYLADDQVAFILSQHRNAVDSWRPHRYRCIRNFKGYASIGTDMWSESLIADLQREGREPGTYNFGQFVVDGVAGNYIMNWFDPQFNDREDDDKDVIDGVYALQQKYMANKKKYGYKSSSLRSIRNGCIFGGWEELVIDRENDHRGEVRFDCLRTDMVIPDLQNPDDNISRNAKELYKEFYLSAEQMIEIYPNMAGKIKEAIKGHLKTEALTPKLYDKPDMSMFQGYPNLYSSKHPVIEYYHFVMEKVRTVISKRTLQPYPDTGYPFGSEEDFYMKAQTAQREGIEFDVNDMVVIDKPKPVLYVTTICRDLGLLLEHRKDIRQLDGKLPFYFWSFLMINGIPVGIWDLIIHAQDDLNKREAAKTKILTETPITGKMYMHPAAFGGAGEKMNEAIRDATDPSKPMVFDEDAPEGIAQTLVGIMNGVQVNPAIFQDEEKKVEFINKIGRLPPAMQGFTERSGESGIHLGRKVIEGSIMQRVPLAFLMEKEKDKAEDWVKMTIKLCGGDGDPRNKLANINREFNDVNGNKVVMNQITGVDEYGENIYKADISKLKHVEVEISQAKENDFVRQMRVEKSVAGLQAMPPTETNAPIRTELEGQLAISMDHTTSEDKERVIEAVNVTRQLAMEGAYLQLIKIKAERLKAEQSLKTIQAMAMGGGATVPVQGQAAPAQPPASGNELPPGMGPFEPVEEETRENVPEVTHVR